MGAAKEVRVRTAKLEEAEPFCQVRLAEGRELVSDSAE